MNLYLIPENQTLLWKTISKVSHFQKKENKEQWFRNIIQHFYNKTSPTINVQELRSLNKETLQYMIQDLKQYSSPRSMDYQGFSNHSLFPNNSLEANTMESRDYIIEQKQTKLNNQFETRQQEYGTMLQRPKVEEIDFTEKKPDDIPLENIDILLQKQLKEREYEIQPIKNDLPKHSNLQSTKKKIAPEEFSNANIELDVQNLEEMEEMEEMEETQKTPKQVSWAPEMNQIPKDEFMEFKKQMQEFMENMKDQILVLQNEIREIKQNNPTPQSHNEKNTTDKIKDIMNKLKNLEKPQISSLESSIS